MREETSKDIAMSSPGPRDALTVREHLEREIKLNVDRATDRQKMLMTLDPAILNLPMDTLYRLI